MQGWAEQELAGVKLGDRRREKRAAVILEAWAQRPEASIPSACATKASSKAAYRFMSHEASSAEAIRAAHAEKTAERAAESAGVILIAQDTTELDFTSLKQTEGLGMLHHPQMRGLLVHSALVMNASGTPLGLIDQQLWVRDPLARGAAKTRRQRQVKQKESQRWLGCICAVEAELEEGTQAWIIGDREADIYALFAAPRREGLELVVRAAHNRKVEQEGEIARLQEHLQALALQGEHRVQVPRSKGAEPQREAVLEVRFGALQMQPPRHAKQRSTLAPVPLWLVEVKEKAPPKGVTPLQWRIWTSVPLQTREQALQVVEAYRQRWKVERYHYVLKSGCQVEDLQLETAERIERALALYAIVAWRLLWLCYQARETPDAPACSVLEEDELAALMLHRQRGKRGAPPLVPPLAEAVRWIAELGGFLGTRKQQPGVKTLWRGLRRLEDLADMYRLLTHPQNVGNG